MNDQLKQLLAELEQFGKQTDLNATERSEKMLNITHDTGAFLAMLVNSTQAKRVLEIGTSNGYSTLWLAHALSKQGGAVTTVEVAPAKTELAKLNFQRAGLLDFIMQVEADAGMLLTQAKESTFDIVFLDSERSAYIAWWPHIRRTLRTGGVLVVDNATSHADELREFIALVTADAGFACKTVEIGNGEFMAVKNA